MNTYLNRVGAAMFMLTLTAPATVAGQWTSLVVAPETHDHPQVRAAGWSNKQEAAEKMAFAGCQQHAHSDQTCMLVTTWKGKTCKAFTLDAYWVRFCPRNKKWTLREKK